MKLELCVENIQGAVEAQKNKFDSIEINSALHLGGLTPSMGLIKELSKLKDIEKNVMIRPRSGGFIYSEDEYKLMLSDLKEMNDLDIDGIVFGFLNEDLTIDTERTKEFVDLIHEAGKKAIFHRAIDNCLDYEETIKQLIDLHVDRILTSGQKEKAIEAKDMLARMQALYGDKIEIVVGAGVGPDNIIDLLDSTEVVYYHASARVKSLDMSSAINVDYSLGDFDYYDVDLEKIKALAELKKKLLENL